MSKTVIITGTSSGIGKETALYFCEKGWNVVATMRNPEKRETELKGKKIDIIHLDVLDQNSIKNAVNYTLKKYKKIDALVNNAGYALAGPFEALKKEKIIKQFDTNIFGLMDVAREIIPVFKKQKQGILINVASMGGRVSFPLYSVYNSSKWAVEGFSESLYYELKQFNIKVKIIEPGVVKTDFYTRSMDLTEDDGSGDYTEFSKRVYKNMEKEGGEMHPKDVARTIFRSATDNSCKLRYQIGKDANQLTLLRKILPESLFFNILESRILK